MNASNAASSEVRINAVSATKSEPTEPTCPSTRMGQEDCTKLHDNKLCVNVK